MLNNAKQISRLSFEVTGEDTGGAPQLGPPLQVVGGPPAVSKTRLMSWVR
jgi:hypothetical protein